MIVLALASGAAAGLKPTAEQAVKDGYSAVKAFIQAKYGRVDLDPLEQKPESDAKRASVAEDLEELGAGTDAELIELARQLADLVQTHDAGAAAAIGVDIANVQASFLRFGDVTAAGPGVRIQDSGFSEGIEFGDVRAGTEASAPENPS
jgi:hypothetical protein